MSHVIAVVFVPKPAHRDDFRRAIIENATASRTLEPGCRQFDVCESADGTETFLYEIYDDEAAFRAHLATEHYKRFKEAVKDWVAGKRTLNYTRVSPAG